MNNYKKKCEKAKYTLVLFYTSDSCSNTESGFCILKEISLNHTKDYYYFYSLSLILTNIS